MICRLGNLKQVLNEVEADVMINTHKIDDEGNESSSNSVTSYLIGIAMTFILYMFIIIYGQLVMMSIIEEKNNRVLEIIVTSIKPTHLMLGKIIGIGAVAVTQVVIWGLLIAGFIEFILPGIVGSQMYAELDALRAGTLDPASATTDLGLLQVMAMLRLAQLHLLDIRLSCALPHWWFHAVCIALCGHRSLPSTMHRTALSSRYFASSRSLSDSCLP